ncbi:kinase-like protein [Gigaspora margarita]|uniref:Kinase-like protein n=1 Tax=Gigaspora margarita TaxID=4874 RepID=A0A8H3XCL2_GIGMA|nr:kinase-like protein [Gigaspora margarita]
MNQQSKNDAFLEQFHIEFFPYNSFEEFEIYNSVISSDSCKVFSVKYNKTIILNKITFSLRYNLESFINDLKQYQKVKLHENILKFLVIFKQSVDEIVFIHEFALDGTLRQYLKQNFNNINWNDKLRFAKQLISAIKEEIFIEYYMEDEDEDQFILGKKNLATDLFCETAKELEIISSVIATLYKDLGKNNLPINIFTLASNSNSFPQASMDIYENIKIEQNFLYNLNQLFITQFNTQTVSDVDIIIQALLASFMNMELAQLLIIVGHLICIEKLRKISIIPL